MKKLKLDELGRISVDQFKTTNKIPVCIHDGFIPITDLKVDLDFLYYYFKNPQLSNISE